MMRIRYQVVDVFSTRPLAGNALCVVLDPVPEPVQPALAREVNLSETTFPVVIADGEYEVRIFTPGKELPFAGHPTLGTAWVLGKQRWVQHSSGGWVVVEADERRATMTQPVPAFEEVDAEPFVRALGLAGAEAAWLCRIAGIHHVVVPTLSPIDRLDPDMIAVRRAAAAAGAEGVAPVRCVDDATLHTRVFVPGAGIAEDPGTGSAAGVIGVVAHRQWSTDIDVVVRQGDEIGRPSRIEVHADPDDLRVGGAVTLVAEGHFILGS